MIGRRYLSLINLPRGFLIEHTLSSNHLSLVVKQNYTVEVVYYCDTEIYGITNIIMAGTVHIDIIYHFSFFINLNLYHSMDKFSRRQTNYILIFLRK